MIAGASRDLILYEKEAGLAWLTLNRPGAHNAINLAMRDRLWEVLEAVRDDPDVEAVIFKGAGESAFSAGADVTEFGTAPSYLAARSSRLQRDVWGAMLASSKPFIAAIQGWALGAGLELSLYCDLRVASPDARFGLPEVKLGYIPSAGGTQTLPRSIMPGVALEMVMSGESVDAARALALGLVHRVASRDRLYVEARTLALSLLDRPRHVLGLAREALAAARDTPLTQGVAIAARLSARSLREASPADLVRLGNWSP